MVLFGRKAYTLAPLTFDHDWLARQLSRLEIGMVEADGTTIGDGLGIAINRLDQQQRNKNGKRRGAFIVLLTDGGESIVDDGITRHWLSSLPPRQAAQIAGTKNIPIFCIGVGKDGYVWEPQFENGKIVDYLQRFSRDLDPGLLHDIAETTGGRYFRAEEKNTIEDAFKAIDEAQKIEFQAKSFLVTTELFPWLAIPGAVLALGGALVVMVKTGKRKPETGKTPAAELSALRSAQSAIRNPQSAIS